MNHMRRDPLAPTRYPHLRKIVGPYLGEDWFYINSYLHDPAKQKFKYLTEAEAGEADKLLELVLNLVCGDNANDKQLISESIEEIEKIIEEVPEIDTAYTDVFMWQLHMPNLPFETWKEYKNFLLRLKQKLQQTLSKQ